MVQWHRQQYSEFGDHRNISVTTVSHGASPLGSPFYLHCVRTPITWAIQWYRYVMQIRCQRHWYGRHRSRHCYWQRAAILTATVCHSIAAKRPHKQIAWAIWHGSTVAMFSMHSVSLFVCNRFSPSPPGIFIRFRSANIIVYIVISLAKPSIKRFACYSARANDACRNQWVNVSSFPLFSPAIELNPSVPQFSWIEFKIIDTSIKKSSFPSNLARTLSVWLWAQNKSRSKLAAIYIRHDFRWFSRANRQKFALAMQLETRFLAGAWQRDLHRNQKTELSTLAINARKTNEHKSHGFRT